LRIGLSRRPGRSTR